MAIVGATCGVVTGPVTCLWYIYPNPYLLLALPISPILGLLGGLDYGIWKDRDYVEFGTYYKPGTYRINMVFLGLRYFPGVALRGDYDAFYEGEDPVEPVRQPVADREKTKPP